MNTSYCQSHSIISAQIVFFLALLAYFAKSSKDIKVRDVTDKTHLVTNFGFNVSYPGVAIRCQKHSFLLWFYCPGSILLHEVVKNFFKNVFLSLAARVLFPHVLSNHEGSVRLLC